MIGTTIVNTLSTIVINVLSNWAYEGTQKVVDTIKLSTLKKEIDEWIEDYCLKNDGSILLSLAFQNYVHYQSPILKIYKYVIEPDIQKPLESIFIGDLVNDCKESVLSSGRLFSVEDNSTVRDFFMKVLNKYKEYLASNLDIAEKYGVYVTGQTIKSESEGVIKEVRTVGNDIKKIYDIISQKEDIGEDKKIRIYFVLCDFLWHGNIEEVCNILPLIESRNQELDTAIKMNLSMISDYQLENRYELDALENIKCVPIKKDIIRKIILLNIENRDLLEKLLLMTEDSTLKQIIEEIKEGDFSNFYTQEVEIQYGAQVKSISKNEYYDTEQWLVNRIMFMYLYKQNNYGIYISMREVVPESKNVLEELFIWQEQELEYIDEFSQNEKIDNLKSLCEELKNKINLYSRLKADYKKIFYFVLIRSAVLTDDIDVDKIIKELPESLKMDNDIQEIIYLLQIKRGVANQQDIVRFCQDTRRYMLLYDFLLQWINTPEKVISFFEDYKYILSEHLAIFLMYVHMVKTVKGEDCSKTICMNYESKYGNYLEFLLELYQNGEGKSVLNTIVTKRKDGSLLYLNNQTEEILIEVFMKNGMYDDALEIIKKYETLRKMSPRKLRMKAAILLAKENVLEALNIFLSIFDVYKHDPYVINNILYISLQNKRIVPDNVMFYAQKSNNVNTLALVAMIYERESDFEMSSKFLTMALLRSDKNNIDIYGKYWGLNVGQNDDTVIKIKNVSKDTAVFLKEIETESTVIYCIYNDKVLPEEPYEWESAIHIYKEYAIKLGLLRRKVGDIIEIGQSKYIITEIMPIDCFLVRKCMTKMMDCGLAKSFCMDQSKDKIQNQNQFIEWIQENITPQKEFDWLEYYKDFNQMPTTFYSLYQHTKLTYEQFVLAMFKEKSVVIRNMLKENKEKEDNGYVLTFSAMILLYKLGVPFKTLNENGVVIPASIVQFSKDEAKTIVDTNARDMVASMGVYQGKLFMNETSEDEKQYWMEESVKIKDYAEKLISLNNYEDVNFEELSNHNLRDLFGICDYDAMSISKKQKKEIISCEATLIIISQAKDLGIQAIDILNFLINIKEPVKNIIRYMKQMLELRLMVIISKRAVDYIAEYFLTVGEKEQEEILMEWNEFLASVESVGKEYKSIFAQISTDILRNKFSESETYDSEVWKLFAQYIFHYNGFFFKCCFNENGEFEIRTYKRMDNVEE